MGYPTNINDFIQQKAAGSEDGLIEVINANPLSPDRLEVPENGFTHETLQGKPYPMQLGAPPPGDNDLRIATLVSMKACSNPADPKIGKPLCPLESAGCSLPAHDIVRICLMLSRKRNCLVPQL